MNYIKYSIIIVLLALSFILGFLSHGFAYKKNILDCSKNICYHAGQNKVKDYVDTKYFNNQTGEKIKDRNFIDGLIKDVENNKLIVEYNDVGMIPDTALLLREIFINNNTVIEKLVKKDEKTYEQEIEEYKKSVKDENKNEVLEDFPPQYEYVAASFSDFKTGQNVFIQAEKNIYHEKAFDASLIRILD